MVLLDKQTCISLTNRKVKAVKQRVKDTAYNANPIAKTPTTRGKYNDYIPEQRMEIGKYATNIGLTRAAKNSLKF